MTKSTDVPTLASKKVVDKRKRARRPQRNPCKRLASVEYPTCASKTKALNVEAMTELNSNTADTAVCEWPSNLAALDWETGATEADAAEIGGEKKKKSAIICGTVIEDDDKENIFSQMHVTESCVTAECSDKAPILGERSANVTTGGKSQRSRSGDGKDVDQLKKRSRKQCIYEGCDKNVVQRGLCWGHGAKYTAKRCSYEGCDKYVWKGGVCWGHGGKSKVKVKRCSDKYCSNQVQNGGVCFKHEAKRNRKICRYEGCDKYAQRKGGVCRKHGANRLSPGNQVSTAASLLVNLSRNV